MSILLEQTRRHFFSDCAVGLGSVALANLLSDNDLYANSDSNPSSVTQSHFEPKAKNVIYLFMAGGPSQFDLFSEKPKLNELNGQTAPDSFFPKEKSFAFIGKGAKLLGSKRKFRRYGESGLSVSELMPHTGEVADDICMLNGVVTDVFNHGPAKLFMNTGFQVPGRPSLGSWVTYGLGSESQNLPGFVVLQSGPRGPRAGSALWSSGFLPSTHQGVPFRGTGDAILNLNSPEGFDREKERGFYDLVGDLNQQRYDVTRDPEIRTRIAASEMAYRMQTSAPELMEIGSEPQHILEMYGAEPGANSYANNCLLARRMIERGVRFVQLYHTDWDHHGNKGDNLGEPLEQRCREVDAASAALVKDLKQRGLLDDTIIIWGGEFGRTPMGEVREEFPGRDHHIDAFSMWVAGGGFKPGGQYGVTDELGFAVTEEKIHVHDLHATLLHQLGFDHEKLSFRFQGRDFRLTDVHGRVVKEVLV
ncbi:hypothetical protein Pla110_16020 [Polystyrenella longa]|uniref:Sulfatase n=1 Tax=Polystyrenella longa TaxID=2528007 RepID=A0A518CKX9_9PLAN|nr:DUF1501 domain-containing protein [Polystyrenella longa]QDU79882.1 hypothetical protein Pla110_16020 [Polystyrenella longa]